MNEDYLWDKSGDADPDIEQLENTLGRLRYKRPAEPLPLPATTRRSFRLSFSPPVLAAAATLLLFLLAGGLWLSLRRPGSPAGENTLAGRAAPTEEKRNEQGFSGPYTPIVPEPGDPRLADGGNKSDTAPPTPIAPRNKLPRRLSPARQETAQSRQRQLSPRREQLAREGEMAKAQLIMALHIASDKLNTVQKKIQVNPGT